VNKRVIGIDLGTTHVVLAEGEVGAPVRVVPLPQLVAAGEIASLPLLPSVLYAPLDSESFPDPWADAPWVVGTLARARGLLAPQRMIASAKSWLSHAAVDRTGPILPWGSPVGTPRTSPVEASTRLLRHVCAAYDAAHPSSPLRRQHVVLTVPASFDPVARELTVEAARHAGLAVRLLEEPQAALYDALATHGEAELAALVASQGSAWVLVCDVGGGTTDLTLFRARRSPDTEALEVERVAVGRHLLLGGDNMDLTLAHRVEARLSPDERLDSTRLAELVLACRAAKEGLLAPSGPQEVPITLLGRGAALVGQTLQTELSASEVEDVILSGFFPEVPRDARPARGGAALVAFGLPYERDPAITRHVASFLARHLPDDGAPLALFLAGGIFNAPPVRERIEGIIGEWLGRPVSALRSTDPDLSIARGAVAYGLALQGHGLRIRSGSPRGYYLGIDADDAKAARAVCVIPRGAPEGERHRVGVRGLSMVVGRPVRFDLYASDVGLHEPGAVVGVDHGELEALAPVTTTFSSSKPAGASLPVELEGELTAVGTLELACVETERERRHRLAFEIRRAKTRPEAPPQSRRAASALPEARAAIDRAFGTGSDSAPPRAVKDLLRELERLLGERTGWPTDVSRELFDALIPGLALRRRSADHERVFWMLAGFCLRPGYGFPGDEGRVAKIARLFAEGVVHKGEARVWQQFFIAFRRVAGGLREKTQLAIRDAIDPWLAPAAVGKKRSKAFRPLATEEMLELASMLERVPPERRAELGAWLLERTWTSRDPRLWRAIGRLGSRMPVYASAHHVVSPAIVSTWLDHLLRERWQEMPAAPRAAFWMARMTGDLARDLPEALRQAVAARLDDAELGRALLEPVPLVDSDRADLFGEALPVGLRLSSVPSSNE
jgi:molecular chaperone DnaK (HSP70)